MKLTCGTLPELWHAEQVDPWSIGLIALIVVGLAAIIFGALWDRRRNKRRAAEMLREGTVVDRATAWQLTVAACF